MLFLKLTIYVNKELLYTLNSGKHHHQTSINFFKKLTYFQIYLNTPFFDPGSLQSCISDSSRTSREFLDFIFAAVRQIYYS